MLEGITEEKIREAEELIKRGYSEKKLRARLGKDWELIAEIARARIRLRTSSQGATSGWTWKDCATPPTRSSPNTAPRG